MIRIMSATEPKGITITVEGSLAGDYVETLDSCVKEAIGALKPIHVFLRDVSDIDESGRELLARLVTQGVRLRAAGVYSSYIVAAISQSAGATEI